MPHPVFAVFFWNHLPLPLVSQLSVIMLIFRLCLILLFLHLVYCSTAKKSKLSKVNVPFKYHKYDELTKLLKVINKKHPDLTRLYSIGKSVEGRELWVMHLTE